MQKVIVVFFLLSIAGSFAQAQVEPGDSVDFIQSRAAEDIETVETEDSVHSPRLAAMYSAAIPGLGQFYNEKYWKIPLVYALGAVAAYQIRTNHQNYLLFLNVQANLENNRPELVQRFVNLGFTPERADRYVQRYRRDRDYWIILAGLFYVLNIVDATVDAHLREFDINENLSMDISPELRGNAFNGMQAGLSLNFKIK